MHIHPFRETLSPVKRKAHKLMARGIMGNVYSVKLTIVWGDLIVPWPTVCINLMLNVYKHENKNQSFMFALREVPVFKNVQELKSYLLKNHAEEISPVKNASSFDIGYFSTRGRKLTSCTDEHLRKAYLTQSRNYVTFWLKPHIPKKQYWVFQRNEWLWTTIRK